jgi:hypothetical protein
LIGGRPARLLERPSCPRAAIIVVIVFFSLVVVVVVVVAVAAISQHHKLLLNPGTLKLSTDPLMAEVACLLVPVEILVDLVVDGVKWSKLYAVPIAYRVNLTGEVSVLNPRVERNSVLRENNTVFFPRDAPMQLNFSICHEGHRGPAINIKNPLCHTGTWYRV